jgi:Tol biopolymer transport system component
MSSTPSSPNPPAPNRTPWVIGGAVGCIVLCIAVAALTGVGYFYFGNSTTIAFPTVAQTRVATALTPDLPTATLLPTSIPLPSLTLAPSLLVTATQTLTPSITSAPRSTAVPTAPRAPVGKIAFSVNRGDLAPDKQVWVMNADGTGAKQVLDRASSPVWSPDGSRIFYYHWEDGIYVANADGSNQHKLVGESNAKYLDISHDGRWLAWTTQSTQSAPKNIDAVLADGTGRRSLVSGGSLPAWSPDDTQLVFHSCRDTTCGLFKANSAGGASVLFTTDVGAVPAWSPNGQRITYQIDVDGIKQIFIINANGTGKKQLTHTTAHHVGAQWSPDGNFIFYRSPEGGSWAIWRMTADGTNPVKLIDNVPPSDEAYEKLAVTK